MQSTITYLIKETYYRDWMNYLEFPLSVGLFFLFFLYPLFLWFYHLQKKSPQRLSAWMHPIVFLGSIILGFSISLLILGFDKDDFDYIHNRRNEIIFKHSSIYWRNITVKPTDIDKVYVDFKTNRNLRSSGDSGYCLTVELKKGNKLQSAIVSSSKIQAYKTLLGSGLLSGKNKNLLKKEPLILLTMKDFLKNIILYIAIGLGAFLFVFLLFWLILRLFKEHKISEDGHEAFKSKFAEYETLSYDNGSAKKTESQEDKNQEITEAMKFDFLMKKFGPNIKEAYFQQDLSALESGSFEIVDEYGEDEQKVRIKIEKKGEIVRYWVNDTEYASIDDIQDAKVRSRIEGLKKYFENLE